MSTPVPDLATLLRQTSISSHEEILKAANAALKKSKSDLTAQHTRVVALLKLDRFDDALRAFEEGGNKLKNEARLEFAYALYKAGELDKAEEVSEKAGKSDRGLLHVAAQTTYKLEKFDKAAQIYEEISSSPDARAEENDLRINRAAIDAQLEWSGLGHLAKNKKPQREDLEAFESAFNAACASIARGELGQGEVLLKRAKQLCSASEDLSEEDKEAEILSITAQLVFVLIRQGRQEEAAKLCENTQLNQIFDLSSRYIAQVNTLSAVPQSNPFLAHRIFHSTPTLPKGDHPFKYQSTILRQDEYALDLLSLKYPGVASSTAAQLAAHPSATASPSVNNLSVLNAAAHARNEVGKPALKAILPLLEKRPGDIGLLLTIVQLYVLTNQTAAATSLLESFFKKLDETSSTSDHDVRFAPGLVGTTVSLYETQGRKGHAKAALAAAAAYWRSKHKPEGKGPPVSVSLLKAAGSSLLDSSNSTDASTASEIFSDLHEQDPEDRASTAGLVAALAMSEASKIDDSLLNALTPAARLVSGIDAAALEEAGVARPPEALEAESKKRAAPALDGNKSKKKRLLKSRTPKDFVEGKEMDPERWLPVRDRSYWKPKGKKGKSRAAGLTQGGPVDDKPQDVPKSAGVVGDKAKKKKKGKR